MAVLQVSDTQSSSSLRRGINILFSGEGSNVLGLSCSPSRQIYVSKLPWARVQACSISKATNGSAFNSPAAVYFTYLSETLADQATCISKIPP